MSLEEIMKRIKPILLKYNVGKASVFGSVARREERKDSDIDILVDIGSDVSLIGFIDIKLALESALGRKVDLVEYAALKPELKAAVLKDQVSVL